MLALPVGYSFSLQCTIFLEHLEKVGLLVNNFKGPSIKDVHTKLTPS